MLLLDAADQAPSRRGVAADRRRPRRRVLAGRPDGRRRPAARREPAAGAHRRAPDDRAADARITPVPRALAAAVGPLPVTSANLSGLPPARDAAEIAAQLGDAVDCIVDGGPAHGGPASTVVDCTVDPVRILRVGAVPEDDVAACLAAVHDVRPEAS